MEAGAGERSDTFRLLTVVYWGFLVVTAVLFMILLSLLVPLLLRVIGRGSDPDEV